VTVLSANRILSKDDQSQAYWTAASAATPMMSGKGGDGV
jgi:hypothetical protein